MIDSSSRGVALFLRLFKEMVGPYVVRFIVSFTFAFFGSKG
jgi:hypothetical protein